MRVLVTGAAGVVASTACAWLMKSANRIVGLDDLSMGFKENIPYGLDFVRGDFNDCSPDFLNSFDVLVHMATKNIIFAMDNEHETYKVNAINTIKLFQKFLGRIVYTSTASVFCNASVIPTPEDHPTHTVGAYDSSKLIASLFLEERGSYSTLVLENVYGFNQRPQSPYAGVVSRMVNSVLNDEPIKINGDGLSTRSYSWCEDVAQAIYAAVELPSLNTSVNIGSGREVDAITLAKIVSDVAGKPLRIEFIPNRKIDVISRRCLATQKAAELLGWKHRTSLEEGIRRTIAWQKNEMR